MFSPINYSEMPPLATHEVIIERVASTADSAIVAIKAVAEVGVARFANNDEDTMVMEETV